MFHSLFLPLPFLLFTLAQSSNICSLPLVTGPCKALFERYGFNNGKCQKFTYGGCGGNENNFQSLEECKNQCENICSLPLVTGPCRAAIRSYILKTVVILHIGTHVAADKPTIGFLSTALRRMNIDDTVLSYICVDNQYYCVRIPHHYSEESMEQSTDFTNLPTSSNTCLEGHDDEEMVMEPPFTTTLKMLNQRANSSDIESSSNKTKREKNKDAVKKHRRKLNEYLEIAPKNIRNMEQIVKELDKSIRETENHIRTLQEMLHKHSTI